jgi:hypothetical protein
MIRSYGVKDKEDDENEGLKGQLTIIALFSITP